MSSSYIVSTFYRFQSMSTDRVSTLQEVFQKAADESGIMGLFLISTEGVNATLAASPAAMTSYKALVQKELGGNEIFFKDSSSEKMPFRRMYVKIREEIVTLGRPDLVPQTHAANGHIEPEEWHQWLEREDVTVIDTRNTYEIELGKFKQAIDFGIDEFREFPERLKAAHLDKKAPVLIYCTGGIRCEKAILEMQEQGFENVKQLNGGIINYLAKYPQGHFEGECFVFDYRVAVDSQLQPSQRYRLCPHCGDPGEEWIDCLQCGIREKICIRCKEKSLELNTCSKNCAHHYSKGHKTHRIHLDGLKSRGRT